LPIALKASSDKRVEEHAWIAEAPLDFLDGRVELNLRVGDPKVADALRVDEVHVLSIASQQPHDEVRVKVAGFEEPHATALTHVPQEVEFFSVEEAAGVVVKGLQVFDELTLTPVEWRRTDLDDLLVQVQQRLVQVLPEPDGLHAAELPRPQAAGLDQRLQLPELLGDFHLRLFDQDAVVSFRLFSHALEVRVVLRQVLILQMGQFPLAFAERVVSSTSSHTMSKLWGIDKAAMQARHIVFQQEDKDSYVQMVLAQVVDR
jgi:hypothetical protein